MAKPKIEGTHNPTKMPDSFSPLNQRVSEKIKESKAAISMSQSAGVNFLSMVNDFVKYTEFTPNGPMGLFSSIEISRMSF